MAAVLSLWGERMYENGANLEKIEPRNIYKESSLSNPI